MIEKNPALVEKLCQAMEEEIFLCQLLAAELKKESEFLRQGSTDSLLESLQSIEVHTGEIRKTHETAQRIAQKILASEGREGEEKFPRLLAVLSPPDSQRVKDYQWTLERLKKGIARINARNKIFVQESLNCWRNLFSVLTDPLADSPVYIQNGKTQASGHMPVSLNRKV